MKHYKFLEHKADVLFEARGASFERALEAAAQALFDTMAKTSKLKETKKVKIKQSAQSLEELVVFTLGALLSESDANELFFKRFNVNKFKAERGGFKIEGVAVGEKEKSGCGGTVVKAVTFHELRVIKPTGKDKEWKIRVLLDV
ncbi:MAG: archease [Candidatus Norongarragalinales archaeon]